MRAIGGSGMSRDGRNAAFGFCRTNARSHLRAVVIVANRLSPDITDGKLQVVAGARPSPSIRFPSRLRMSLADQRLVWPHFPLICAGRWPSNPRH